MAMMTRSFSKIALAVLCCAAAPSPIAAKDRPGRNFPVSDNAAALRAWQDICMAHAGDPAAQIEAAKAAPYTMTFARGTAEDVTYDNDKMFAAVRGKQGENFCMVAFRVASGTDLRAAASQFEKQLPAGVIRMKDEATQVGWANPVKTPLTIYMYSHQDAGSDYVIASYMVGVVTK